MENIFLFESEDHQFSLVEGVNDGDRHFYIRGKFATINTVNVNKRIYSRELWEREVAKYQKEIEEGTINTLMEWEHPQGRLKVDPKNAVAKIRKLWIEGDYVMGEAVIFDNPQADTIKSMIRHGVKISVSSRASGSVGAGGHVKEFNLITFDIVTSPSDRSATMGGVFESEETKNEDETMADEALMGNLVSILRTKNTEIRDLNEEIELLRQEISKYESLGVGSTDREYSNDGDYYYSGEHNPYSEEDNEYSYRRAYAGFNDTGDYRHQDVNYTLRDNDPSGYYHSGESEEPRIRKVLNGSDRAEMIGRFLGGDVNSNLDDRDGYSGPVNESAEFTAGDILDVLNKQFKLKLDAGKEAEDYEASVKMGKASRKHIDSIKKGEAFSTSKFEAKVVAKYQKGDSITLGFEDSNGGEVFISFIVDESLNESADGSQTIQTVPVTGNRFLMVPSHLI